MSQHTVVDSLTAHYQKEDDVENYTYACLDYFLLEPTEENLNVLEQYEMKRWRAPSTADDMLAYVILLCNKGFYLTRYGNLYEAVDAYEKAWTLFEGHQRSNFDIIEYCLKPLGNNYSMLGDYTSAENIIKRYLFLAEQEKNNDHIAGAAVNLSIIYHDAGQYQDAIELLSSTLQAITVPPEKKGLVYSNLARNYLMLQESKDARQYSELAIRYFNRYPDVDANAHLINVYKVLALVRLQEKDTAQALSIFKQVQALAMTNESMLKARELAKVTLEYAGLLKMTREYDEALTYYQQALHILLPSYRLNTARALPDPATFYAENAIKEALDGMADLYERLQQNDNAIACYELSFVVEDLLRSTYNYQHAKLQQQVENRRRADRVIQLLHTRYAQTNDQRFAHRAFQVAERTKSITLKEMVEDRYLKRLILHDSLLRYEQQLRFKQASLANELVLEQRKEQPDTERLEKLISQQTSLTIENKAVQQVIQERYNISTGTSEWLDVDHVKTMLKQDEAVLIEYFSGKDFLFQFVVTADSLSFHRLQDSKTLNESILRINELFTDAANINNQLEEYKKSSHALFHQLGLTKAGDTRNLLLVPDGLLHLIPFDALLYEEAEGIQYAAFPYLIKKYVLAYQPSALLYTQYRSPAAPLKDQTLLAMFPEFENTAQSLEYSAEEARNIGQYFPAGTFVTREQAVKQSFISQASAYSIVHLSTHALASHSVEPPSIYFRDSVLYLPEIYGMHLSADLMVLSACETGLGHLAKGEGALSLAHGFQFAGVKNIILSLWKVNDRSTAHLFADFYRHYLKTGHKAESLQQAKLDYLSDDRIQNIHKSPFYWAAFIYYGDYDVNQPSLFSFNLTGSIILLIVFFLLIFLVLRKNRKRKEL